MSDKLIVEKTLVIGLGTTGTQICDMIAARIRWEYGDTARTPWVRFLCLETNVNGAPSQLSPTDFIPLSISENEYGNLIRFDPAYDESIQLSRWADAKTLNAIPKKAVDDGVGNVRMVGRLAFFYKRNYDAVRNAVERRLNELRDLIGADAADKLDKLPDGSAPSVQFAGQNTVRLFVVGTLCGGTCSGLAGDFGYFLQSLTQEQEKVIAFFTLPHPDLSIASEPMANRLKKNAYTALVELNHYHLLSGVEKEVLRFPGHRFSTVAVQPYDLPFLAVPRQTSAQSRRELESAIADRIFLNAFVPDIDPFAATVNASIMDREGHAHSFCTFGLATLEFPAQRVIEACGKMLLLKAVREWKMRALPDHLVAPRLEEIGLTAPRIRQRLLRTDDGLGLEKRMEEQITLLLQAARRADPELARELGTLRAAFGVAGMLDAGSACRPNLVPQTIAANSSQTAQQIYQDLKLFVQTRLLQYEEGPGRLRDLLGRAKARLNDLKTQPPADTQPETKATDDAVARVNGSRHKRSFFSKELIADPDALARLERAVRQEVEARLDSEVQRAIRGGRVDDRTLPSVADSALRLIEPVLTRVDNLRNRLTDYQSDLERSVDTLTRTAPEVNGIALFDTDRYDGTVLSSYKDCLEKESGDPTVSWEMEEGTQTRLVIEGWMSLPNALFPGAEPDWLGGHYLTGSGEPVPKTETESLMGRAVAPFRRLSQVNVVERWNSWPDRNQEIERSCRMMSAFLNVEATQAERGGRAPIQKRTLALVPDRMSEEFKNQVRAKSGIEDFRRCPDPYRAVLIEEWYRFPLYGTPSIVGGMNSLADARSTDFPTFHTRKDVFWTGLSSDDIRKTQEAEELTVVAVLLQELRIEGGTLVMSWTPRISGDPAKKFLPLSIRGAARALVFERTEPLRAENNGKPNGKPPALQEEQALKGAMETLRDRVEQRRKALRGDTNSDIELVRLLDKNNVSGDYNAIPDWRDNNLAGRLIQRFCARDPELYHAYATLFPPDSATIARMTKRKGEARPSGGVYGEDGLYCINESCCGWIGKDAADAARNGWRCFIHPEEHDYSAII